MTLSRWSFSSSPRLRGVGVDAERVERFVGIASRPGNVMPFVFSKRELAFHRRSRSPARGLCASFCCKEAVFKALGQPYNYDDCELFYCGQRGRLPIRLAPGLLAAHGLTEAWAVVRSVGRGRNAEILVAAFVF